MKATLGLGLTGLGSGGGVQLRSRAAAESGVTMLGSAERFLDKPFSWLRSYFRSLTVRQGRLVL